MNQFELTCLCCLFKLLVIAKTLLIRIVSSAFVIEAVAIVTVSKSLPNVSDLELYTLYLLWRCMRDYKTMQMKVMKYCKKP